MIYRDDGWDGSGSGSLEEIGQSGEYVHPRDKGGQWSEFFPSLFTGEGVERIVVIMQERSSCH